VCEQGLTAEAWARKRGHVALADLIARGGEDESESEARRALRMRACASVTNAHARPRAAQEEGGEEAAAGGEEETSTQRSRRKKKEMDAFESRGAKLKAVPADAPEEEEDAESGGGGGAAAAAASAPPRDAPTWPEVAKALESGPKELVLERGAGGMADEGVCVDPALWRCTSLNLLKLSLKGADAAAPKPLRALPDGIRFLTGAIRAGSGCTAAAMRLLCGCVLRVR
jgi:leucine-rich repeat protein SHOC2